MAEDTEEAESEVAGCLALLDVVQIPSVGALVYNHLGPEGCKQARLVCRALCMLVDTNISQLRLELPDTLEEEHKLGLRLKQRHLQPESIEFKRCNYKNSHRGDALAAAGLDFFMERVRQVVITGSVFFGAIAQVLLLSRHRLTSLSVPRTGDGWRVLDQYTALQHLGITGYHDSPVSITLNRNQWQTVGRLRCLRSLTLEAPLLDFSPLTHLTQLTQLNFLHPHPGQVQHADALTHLTALEDLYFGYSFQQNTRLHDSVAQVVGVLSSLRNLTLPWAFRGAWTDAVGRLTLLTQLNLFHPGRTDAAHPIHLPSVKVLTVGVITASQLALITAPCLTRLAAFEEMRTMQGMGQYMDLIVLMCEPGQLGSIRQSAAGLMRHCSRVCLSCHKGPGSATPWPAQESHAALAALCQSWRPTATVTGTGTASPMWELYIESMEFGPAESTLIPAGITHLTLWHCKLAPGSLAPLARLSSLRELSLVLCLSLESEELGTLLTSAVQGKDLRIHVYIKHIVRNRQPSFWAFTHRQQSETWEVISRPTEQDYRDVHSSVVAARGLADTPRLTTKTYTEKVYV